MREVTISSQQLHITEDKYVFKSQTKSTYSSYRTRHCVDIQIAWIFKLQGIMLSIHTKFHYLGLEDRNNIPITIREFFTLQLFKQHLKLHLRT